MAEIKFDTFEITQNLMNLKKRVYQDTQRYAETEAVILTAEMQKNRTWTDRSARARQALNGKAYRDPTNTNRLVIQLAHGVEYGIYLEGTNNPNWSSGHPFTLSGMEAEFAFEKKYAIVQRTIREKGPEVISGWFRLMSLTGGGNR